MFDTLRESASTCHVGCTRTQFRLTALPQVSVAISHAIPGQDAFVVVLLALAVVTAVMLTAIWSRDKDRRQAALDVLDRISRWHS